MNALIDRHIIKIQVGVALGFVFALATLIWQVSAFASTMSNTVTRVDKLEAVMSQVASKDDIRDLKKDLKDYINKK